MLQRSPTYIVSLPARDAVADALRRRLPAQAAYVLVRWKNVLRTLGSYQLSRRRPEAMKRLLRKWLTAAAPGRLRRRPPLHPELQPVGSAPVPRPRRRPVRGDPLRRRQRRHRPDPRPSPRRRSSSSRGSGSRPTSSITATGLNLQLLGGRRAGGRRRRRSNWPNTVAYKGMMLSGVPNMALALGYTNASWTLKCDLISEYVCRLLRYLDERGLDSVDAGRAGPVRAAGADARPEVRVRPAGARLGCPSRGRGCHSACTRTTSGTSACSAARRSTTRRCASRVARAPASERLRWLRPDVRRRRGSHPGRPKPHKSDPLFT